MASNGAPDDHDVMEIGAEEYDLEDDEDVSGEANSYGSQRLRLVLQGCEEWNLLALIWHAGDVVVMGGVPVTSSVRFPAYWLKQKHVGVMGFKQLHWLAVWRRLLRWLRLLTWDHASIGIGSINFVIPGVPPASSFAATWPQHHL